MALPASADPQVDRAIAASERMMVNLLGIIESCAPSLSGKLGDGGLTPEMEAATACQVRRLQDRVGSGTVEEYLAALEDYAGREFSSFMAFANGAQEYDILDNDVLTEIGKECGAIEASMSSPFSRAMSDNPMAMAACFAE